MADDTISFVPMTKHIAAYRGDPVRFRMRFSGDVTARSFAAQIKPSSGSTAEPLAEFTLTAEYDEDDGKTYVRVFLSGDDTAALPDVAAWDVQYTPSSEEDPDAEPKTLARGTVTATGQVTVPSGS